MNPDALEIIFPASIFHRKPKVLEVFMVNKLVFRWPKPLFFVVLGLMVYTLLPVQQLVLSGVFTTTSSCCYRYPCEQ